jgi:type IV pilus assembly protein PilY1
MTANLSHFRFQTLTRVLLPLLLVGAPLVYAQTPAQMPLLTKGGAAVSPNVVLTLDDSGSMQFQHMPETTFAPTNIGVVTNPVGGAQVRSDKNDTYQADYLRGTVPGVLGSGNYVLKAIRSPDTNTIFYNPEIQYRPWLTSDGVTRWPNSPVATAYIDPVVRTGAAGTFVNLTALSGTFAAGSFTIGTTYKIVTAGSTSFTAIGAANNSVGTSFVATGPGSGTGTASTGSSTAVATTGWCFVNGASSANTSTAVGGGCAPVLAAFFHDPGVYFRLNKVSGAYLSVNDATHYTGYSINTVPAGSFIVGTKYKITTRGSTLFTSIGASSNSVGTEFTATGVGTGTGWASQVDFTKYPNRADCTGATCTQAQEQQNYANWFSYYRNRNLLARGALLEAFGVEAAPVTAGTFVIGTSYAIVSAGSTSFTAIGAASNTVDTVFTATGAGAGTGTARAISMRLGFGTINKNDGGAVAVDGVATKVLESETATYGGGGVRDFNFARKDQLFKWLQNLPKTNKGTPLVPAMEAVGQYYSRTDSKGPWTDFPGASGNVVANNKTCRRSYNIMTTDGYWNGAVVAVGNQDGTDGTTITGDGQSYKYVAALPYSDSWSNTLADVAMKYWKTDLQPATVNLVPAVAENTSFWQNMTNFTVGLGVKGTLDPLVDLPALTGGTITTAGTTGWPKADASTFKPNVDDLWHAALNSRGKYFSAKDPNELATAIRTALAGATGGAGATAGVATAASLLSTGNRKYVPKFNPGSWDGRILAFNVNASGVADSTEQWDAAKRMPAWGSRNIVTWDSTAATWAGIPFAWSSLPSASRTALGSVAATYTTQFIDFLKGDHSQEGVGFPFRTRKDTAGEPFILGDIVNSNPVLIKSNFDGAYVDPAFGGATAYATFKAAKAARTAVLFAGSNDGMLHAFKDTLGASAATDGTEIFAYVPRAVYADLYKLADKNYGTTVALQHQYFVDGPLHEADAYVKAPSAASASWRNYLFGSLGAGGRAVFALDVTDSASMGPSSVRWELSSVEDDDIGYMTTPVKVGVLSNGRWVAVFGNGFSSTNGKAVLFVVDIEDAASSNAATRASAIQKLVLDSTGSNGLGGVTLIPNPVTGRTEFIYVGDLKGKLWKIKYNTTTNLFAVDTASPTGLFAAKDPLGAAQPITSSPAVFRNDLGGYMVLFGTGKLFSTADASDTATQSVYGVWDKDAGATAVVDTVPRPLTRSNLEVRTLTSFAGTGLADTSVFYSASGAEVDYSSTTRGWYMDLSPAITGGRVIYPSQVVGFKTALLSSVAPVQGTPLACQSGKGSALNLLVPVEQGSNPTNHSFDTNGDGSSNGSDTVAIGYQTIADGVDAVVSSAGVAGGSRLTDVGGGGPEGDCTGAVCSKKCQKCESSPLCPEANTCLSSIQSATMGFPVCIPVGAGGTRVWRRIINPPIR